MQPGIAPQVALVVLISQVWTAPLIQVVADQTQPGAVAQVGWVTLEPQFMKLKLTHTPLFQPQPMDPPQLAWVTLAPHSMAAAFSHLLLRQEQPVIPRQLASVEAVQALTMPFLQKLPPESHMHPGCVEHVAWVTLEPHDMNCLSSQ